MDSAEGRKNPRPFFLLCWLDLRLFKSEYSFYIASVLPQRWPLLLLLLCQIASSQPTSIYLFCVNLNFTILTFAPDFTHLNSWRVLVGLLSNQYIDRYCDRVQWPHKTGSRLMFPRAIKILKFVINQISVLSPPRSAGRTSLLNNGCHNDDTNTPNQKFLVSGWARLLLGRF